jgi:ketosteroid isomerase-like protein
MSEAALEVVRRMSSAFNARRYDEMLALFDPAAEFTDHVPLPDVDPSVRGQAGMRDVLAVWSEGFDVFEGHIEEFIELEDFVVCVTTWRFVSSDEGLDMTWKGAEAWRVREARIVWGQTGFRDRQDAIDAVQRELAGGS